MGEGRKKTGAGAGAGARRIRQKERKKGIKESDGLFQVVRSAVGPVIRSPSCRDDARWTAGKTQSMLILWTQQKYLTGT